MVGVAASGTTALSARPCSLPVHGRPTGHLVQAATSTRLVDCGSDGDLQRGGSKVDSPENRACRRCVRWERQARQIWGHTTQPSNMPMLCHKGRAWHTRTAGTGTKGGKLFSWARIRINGPAETTELAAVPTLQTPTGETGPDHYQVRQYGGWYRHITSPCSGTLSSALSVQKRGPTFRLRPADEPSRARNQAPPHTDRLAPRIRPPPRDPRFRLARKTSTPLPAMTTQRPRPHPTNATVIPSADRSPPKNVHAHSRSCRTGTLGTIAPSRPQS